MGSIGIEEIMEFFSYGQYELSPDDRSQAIQDYRYHLHMLLIDFCKSLPSGGSLAQVLQEVSLERLRQDSLWGVQRHAPERWLSILGEEFGEVCKAVCEASFPNYKSYKDYTEYRKELIQVAAVAVAMIESLDATTVGSTYIGEDK